jgi:very-short-patch-repair endonuclease
MHDRQTAPLPKVEGMHPTIEAILAEAGAISVRDHPRFRSELSRLKQAGMLDNPLPGSYLPMDSRTRHGWLQAVCAWAGPKGTIHGRSAAGIWLPDLAGPVAFLAHPTLRSRRGVQICHRLVPAEFIVTKPGVRFASPAYAAVELAATDDGRAICEALRLGFADTNSLEAALQSLRGTRGHATRREAVAACADNPWSYAELRLHRILRETGITDWVANRPLRVGGRELWPDVRMRKRKLVIEFDGRAVHDRPAQFLADREWQNTLEAAGYHVLRFGWEHLDQPDYVVATTRAAERHALPA